MDHSDNTSKWQAPEIHTFSGVCTFMRCPVWQDQSDLDVAILGIPFDLGTTYRPGARFGPLAIRNNSAQLARRKMFPWGFNPTDVLRVMDSGDLQLDIHNPENVFSEIVKRANDFLCKDVKLLCLGGDHYISYPLLKAHFQRQGGPLRLLHFDAHTDTWPDMNLASISHGTMFYKAVLQGLIDVDHSVQVGIRTWNDDTLGLHQIVASDMYTMSDSSIVARILEILGDGPVYLTFDIDCLDPAYAPGTGTPVVGGISTPRILSILRALKGINLVGADVVEVAPAYDHGDITANAAAHIAAEILCLFATAVKQ